MHIEIGDHTVIDELSLHKVAGQLDSLLLRHLARNRELDLARQLRVLAKLGRLDRIPESFAIGEMLGRAVRQHHLGVNNARLVREIVVPIEPLIVRSEEHTSELQSLMRISYAVFCLKKKKQKH